MYGCIAYSCRVFFGDSNTNAYFVKDKNGPVMLKLRNKEYFYLDKISNRNKPYTEVDALFRLLR